MSQFIPMEVKSVEGTHVVSVGGTLPELIKLNADLIAYSTGDDGQTYVVHLKDGGRLVCQGSFAG